MDEKVPSLSTGISGHETRRLGQKAESVDPLMVLRVVKRDACLGIILFHLLSILLQP